MISLACLARRAIVIVVGGAWLTQATAQAAAPPPASQNRAISTLIDRLRDIAKGDVGYMPTRSGSGFLPLGTSQPGTLLLGGSAPTPSNALQDLVKHGAAAVPQLIAHLDDTRTTRITVKHDSAIGGMCFRDEYDWNRRTTKQIPGGVNRDRSEDRSSHTVTVGDLCFVALGQIVNRRFAAVRYQPTANIMINSPTSSVGLRKAIKKEWGTLTSTGHKESLVRDFLEPDHEYRCTEAALRLGYYYPKALEPLVLKQLAKQRYNCFTICALVRDKLYPAKSRKDRQALVDAFVAKEGTAAREGILLSLFSDLGSEEADDEGRLSPPLKPKYAARACLVELFGYPKGVKSTGEPYVNAVENCRQARFIDAIPFFPTAKIDQAVRKVFHSTDEDYLARACARYLVGRGSDADIRKYVEQRLKGAGQERRKQLLRLQEQIGWTAMHAAAEMGLEDKVKELIRSGADINARAGNGQTPLHIAASGGKFGIVRLLMKRKANPNIKDRHGLTPVQYAARNHFEAAVETLLANGAEVADILVAAFAGRADLVQAFLKKDQTQVRAKTDWGETALHIAATYNHVKVAEVLLAQGADVNASSESGLTPLHRAADYSGRELIALLLKHKANK
jgi:ankyrin repeat protein